MPLNLAVCDKACLGCVKSYKKKFSLKEGDKWKIKCRGIPENYVSQEIKDTFSNDELIAVETLLDPVRWAGVHLDWHCLDPKGEVWKRKNPAEYNRWVKENPDKDIYGNSRYHRPYQAVMLRCNSAKKVFRIGRQAGKTEALVISMLYHLFTKPGLGENEAFKIVVIAPFQTQIELIFNRIKELIKSSPDLADSVHRDVKAPNYTIELKNGSVVRGFTAGTKSGGNADSVRGQHAHMLVFDEADYLSAGDIDSALAVVTNYPDHTIWMSSTPTGARSRFYDTCHSKLWKEFHFPSHVNPMWTSDLDETYKEQLTSSAYDHEILADFGEKEEGVFQNTYVEAAMNDYKYSDQYRVNGWVYSMGVDWNDVKNGTLITIIGYNPAKNIFKIVAKDKVQKAGWNQLAACNKIASLNRIWKPNYIYIDSGHGSTQWEVLRLEGFNAMSDPNRGKGHPDSRLKDIKKYEFGGTIETYDLFTKQKIKKPAKPFLVENTVRRFESGNIIFSSHDEELKKQLQNYAVKRINTSGVPVYETLEETIGDHALDSAMLALVAFTLEDTPFGKIKHRVDIAFTGNFGERIDALVSEGDLVIKRDRKDEVESSRNKTRPEMNRTEVFSEKGTFLNHDGGLPANHVKTEQDNVGLWVWEGFSRDKPRPKVRSFRQATKDSEKRLGISRRNVGKPKRKNF